MNNDDAVAEQYALETRWLRAKLHQLQEDYVRAQKPYIDRLVQIESTRIRPITITVEQYES